MKKIFAIAIVLVVAFSVFAAGSVSLVLGPEFYSNTDKDSNTKTSTTAIDFEIDGSYYFVELNKEMNVGAYAGISFGKYVAGSIKSGSTTVDFDTEDWKMVVSPKFGGAFMYKLDKKSAVEAMVGLALTSATKAYEVSSQKITIKTTTFMLDLKGQFDYEVADNVCVIAGVEAKIPMSAKTKTTTVLLGNSSTNTEKNNLSGFSFVPYVGASYSF